MPETQRYHGSPGDNGWNIDLYNAMHVPTSAIVMIPDGGPIPSGWELVPGSIPLHVGPIAFQFIRRIAP